jgi:hypothetical protein
MKIYSIGKYMLIDNDTLIVIDNETKQLASKEVAEATKQRYSIRNNTIAVNRASTFNKVINYLANNEHKIIKVL